MSSSNCSFLTCIKISQEAGQVVWYSHLFQNCIKSVDCSGYIVILTILILLIREHGICFHFFESSLLFFIHVYRSVCNAGDPGLIPGLGRSPGEGNGYPLQCSCLKNCMEKGAWWAVVHGVAKSRTQLSQKLSLSYKSLTTLVRFIPKYLFFFFLVRFWEVFFHTPFLFIKSVKKCNQFL